MGIEEENDFTSYILSWDSLLIQYIFINSTFKKFRQSIPMTHIYFCYRNYHCSKNHVMSNLLEYQLKKSYNDSLGNGLSKGFLQKKRH